MKPEHCSFPPASIPLAKSRAVLFKCSQFAETKNAFFLFSVWKPKITTIFSWELENVQHLSGVINSFSVWLKNSSEKCLWFSKAITHEDPRTQHERLETGLSSGSDSNLHNEMLLETWAWKKEWVTKLERWLDEELSFQQNLCNPDYISVYVSRLLQGCGIMMLLWFSFFFFFTVC